MIVGILNPVELSEISAGRSHLILKSNLKMFLDKFVTKQIQFSTFVQNFQRIHLAKKKIEILNQMMKKNQSFIPKNEIEIQLQKYKKFQTQTTQNNDFNSFNIFSQNELNSQEKSFERSDKRKMVDNEGVEGLSSKNKSFIIEENFEIDSKR